MNKEVHYEGWLIKSPPTKRIWRAQWRRRWFTLKQGEIPEQFCLEYYTDRNCRKLKGVIDLDQCEQVDCGLRLENRKQKFQFMFDIKTPKRTYYLAADTEADMRDWVNCICQVCHLHDTKQPNNEHLVQDETHSVISSSTVSNYESTKSSDDTGNDFGGAAADFADGSIIVTEQPHLAMMAGGFNNSRGAYVNTDYSNRINPSIALPLLSQQQQQQQHQLNSSNVGIYLNSSVIQQPRQDSPYEKKNNSNNSVTAPRLAVNTNGVVRKLPKNLVLYNSTVVTDMADAHQLSGQPLSGLSTASGPYIPISECFSGSPKSFDTHNPTTPLNNLDPKFYDTPRSHNNIGLNLTNDQSYSPKITNCGTLQGNNTIKNRSHHRSDSDSESVFTTDDEGIHPLPLRDNVDRHTRPSDSSVENEPIVIEFSQRFSKFPDDSAVSSSTSISTSAAAGNGKNAKRLATLTSLASTLKEGPTAATVKVNSIATTTSTSTTKKSVSKSKESTISRETGRVLEKCSGVFKNKNNLSLELKHELEKTKTRDLPQFSDTENTSPAIGLHDTNSVAEESYDIPRSHKIPYCNVNKLFPKNMTPDHNAPIAASTPNLMASNLMFSNGAEGGSALNSTSTSLSGGTLPRPNYYTNAAPRKVEGTFFRYDFVDESNLPPVNRELKPKINPTEGGADKPPEEVPPLKPATTTTLKEKSIVKQFMAHVISCEGTSAENTNVIIPPSVDRKLKPNAYRVGKSATISHRTCGTLLSKVHPNDCGPSDARVVETQTLPRLIRPNYAIGESMHHHPNNNYHEKHQQWQHNKHVLGNLISNQMPQRKVTAAVPTPFTLSTSKLSSEVVDDNERKIQYFDLDVTNAPSELGTRLAKKSPASSVGGIGVASSMSAGVASAGVSVAPITSSVVYNSVDFVKTEGLKIVCDIVKKQGSSTST